MARVLHVLGGTSLGGAESRIMDLYRHTNRDQVQFDFLVHMDPKKYAQAIKQGVAPETLREPQHYDAEIQSLGGQIYCLPRFKIYNYFVYKKAIKRFFNTHSEYTVVQGHMTSTAAIYLPIAKKLTRATTVAHARSAGVDAGMKGKITKFLRRYLWKRADYLFTCSDLAGKAVFGDHDYMFIPNAIDAAKYQYDEALRQTVREEFQIPQDAIVLGHVGRFHYAKNHEYLLRIFASLREKELALPKEAQKNCYLLLLGEGSRMDEMKALAKELQVEQYVIFAGNKSNPERYYHAFDLFVFPSRFEGLPGTVLEAQAAGLPCLLSDTIAKETAATNLVQWENIEKEPSVWADHVVACMNHLPNREKGPQMVAEAGFDVATQAKRMETFYTTGDASKLR